MVGDLLPNEGHLAKKFGVSVGTIRKAIEGLETNGLVKRIQGRGTYVAGIGSHVLRQKFVRLRGDDVGDTRLSYDLISIERVPTPADVAEAAGWNREMELLRVVQLVRFGGAGFGRAICYLPLVRLPNFQKHMTFGQDLYPLLADYGIIVTSARERLSLTTTSRDIMEDLGAEEGGAVFQLTRIAYCMEKTPVEHRVSHYLATGFNYDIEID